MPDNFVKTTVGEFISKYGGEIKTGPFGTKLKASEYTATGVPLISVREIGDGAINLHKDTPTVDETVFSRMPEYVLHEGDIVFGRKGAVERCARVQKEQDGWFLGSDGIRLRLPKECDTSFIAYQFMTNAHRTWMVQHASGTTMASLNQNTIERIPLVLPPIKIQQSISSILGSLDDKIDLNRRMNRTLERIAETLFKRWFVDFEFPDENGKPYKSSGGEMVDSELGEIPKGWSVRTIGTVIEVIGGGTPKTDVPEYWQHGDIPWYIPSDLTKNPNLFSLATEKQISKKGLESSSAKMFPAYSLLLTSRATIGEIAFNTHPACCNQGFIVLIQNEQFPFTYLHGWVRTAMPEIMSRAHGTTFKEVNKGNFRQIPVCISPINGEYARIVTPIYGRIEKNIREIESLQQSRNSLLPQLIIGKVQP